MTIKEVCDKFSLSPDTLRYYERVGVIPTVNRTAGGIHDYTEEDISWVQNAVCFRNAGLPVEKLIEYVRLLQMGNTTISERCVLLKEAREDMLEARRKYDEALKKLDYKISCYEEAERTGVLIWSKESVEPTDNKKGEAKDE